LYQGFCLLGLAGFSQKGEEVYVPLLSWFQLKSHRQCCPIVIYVLHQYAKSVLSFSAQLPNYSDKITKILYKHLPSQSNS